MATSQRRKNLIPRRDAVSLFASVSLAATASVAHAFSDKNGISLIDGGASEDAESSAERLNQLIIYKLKPEPKTDAIFNQILDHIPWIRGGTNDGSLGKELRFRPGMRLNIVYWALKGSEDYRALFQAPGISRYQWVIPTESGPFDHEDLFFLSYLLTIGLPGNFGDIIPDEYQDLIKWMNDLSVLAATADFYEVFVMSKLSPVIKSLRVEHVRSGPFTNPSGSGLPRPWTSAAVRKWFTQPNRHDFDAKDSAGVAGQLLCFSLPTRDLGLLDVTVLGQGNSPFFNNHKGLLETGIINESGPDHALRNKWYDIAGNVYYNPRVFMSADVPVRLQFSNRDESESRFYPFYWSIGDLQQRLRLEIHGVRRHERYLPDVSKGLVNSVIGGSLPGTTIPKPPLLHDDYYTIWFSDFGQAFGEFGASAVIQGESIMKDNILLAPGDVILCGGRLAPSDNPEIR